MEVRLFGSSASTVAGSTLVRPYTVLVAETQLTISDAAVTVVLAAGAFSYLVQLKNTSAGGQVIRVGAVPTFAVTPKGIPLDPGDYLTWYGLGVSLAAIASVAGGLLESFIVRTA